MRYAVIELPPVSAEVMEEFGHLPFDPYTGGRQRYRRFSQFRLHFEDGEGRLEVLPHRPFVQPSAYNALVGGVQRTFEPLRIDPTPQVVAGARALQLDESGDWQVNVHQCRVITDEDIQGVSVPEGPHRDGHEFGMLAVFARHNITGGENQLMPVGGGEPFFRVTLQANQALVFSDEEMWHHATDIVAAGPGRGHRDMWIVVYNRWDRRHYGADFEAEAVTRPARA